MLKSISKEKTGFTLVEVIVAAMIFALASAGLFATMTAISRPAGVSTREVKAALLGKQVLADLRNKVDAATWNDLDGDLLPGTHDMGEVYNEDGISYRAVYEVEETDIGARKVTLNIIWTELN